jgi:hypothetical protein
MKASSKRLLSLVGGTLFCALTLAQSPYVKLPGNVNHPGLKGHSPYISLDGNSLLFVSNYSEDQTLNIFYTTKGESGWKDPVALPRHLNQKLNFPKGFAISPDGRQVFITNNRSSGFGGYDLYSSELRGTTWTELQNLGLGVNSNLHESSPTLSLDGSTLYFMRCTKMDNNTAEGCKLFMAKRKAGNLWDTPVELPPFINTGNSQTPRILGDSETLIFSSALFGGKGGMEWLRTRFDGRVWSPPVLLDFANTPGDDQYGSASAVGRYWLCDRPVKSGTEMAEILFPPDAKPKATMRIEGRVTGVADLSAPFVYATNLETGQVIRVRPTKDGTFRLYLPEGSRYDVSVEPDQDSGTFFSTQYDLTQGKIPIMERLEAAIGQVAPGMQLPLNGIVLDAESHVSVKQSREEFRRLERLLKGNRDRKFVLDVELTGYRRDSLATDGDLTEVEYDSLRLMARDSTDSIVVKTYYHNDRTVQQGLEVLNQLLSKGIPADQIMLRHRALPGTTRPGRTRFRLLTD